MNFIKSIAVALVLSVASINTTHAQTTGAPQPTDSVVTAVIKVKGITCASDIKTIAANVEKLQGVKSFKSEKQGPTTTFQVVFNPAIITTKDIYTAIEDTNGCENPDDRPYKVKQ